MRAEYGCRNYQPHRLFFFSSRRRHTRWPRDWSSDVCSSDLQRDLSGSAFRRLCRAEFLNYLRVREWQDVVAQLRQLAKPLGLTMRPLALPGRDEVGEDPAAAAVAVDRKSVVEGERVGVGAGR